jgi:hypothetical protein
VCCFWIHFVFPLVVDTCVLQPPIATLGETASASQVLLKGPVVRACWCIVRDEPWVFPCANKWFHCRDRDLLEGMSRWFPSKTKIQKWIVYEWLARLADTQFEIRSRPPMVWTSTLIKKVKRVDNVMSRAVDHWFDSTIGGYIIEFSIDRVESYSQEERYFFKGSRGNFLHFLKLKIKMLLHEKNILKIQ